MIFPVRLYHAKHGFTHAHDTQEMERLQKLGWSEDPVPTASTAVLEGFKKTRGRPRKVA